MFTSIAAAPINHVIHGESWACKRLQNYAGKIVRIRVLPLVDFTFTILEDGQISTMPSDTTADASITLSPAMLPLFLAKNDAVYNNIKTSGDKEFTNELIDIGKNLHWDVAQDLSKIMGDIPAYRIVQAGESLIEWQTKSLNNFSETLAEYWLEEQPLLAKSLSIKNFTKEVDSLLNSTIALEERIKNLTNRMP